MSNPNPLLFRNKDVDDKKDLVEFVSIINKNYKITPKNWVVSVVNTRGNNLLSGHAVLVVEGIKENQTPFVYQYDITANAPDEMPNQGSLNQKGFITKIRYYEENNKADYTDKPSESYYYDPESVKRMIDKIKKEAALTEKAMANLKKEDAQKERGEDGKIIELLRYQKLGKDHFLVKLLGDTEHGQNCAGWCYDKLDINRKPKPPMSCIIL